MTIETYAFPPKPYDEVVSQFIRERIRRGSFENREFRQDINTLVWLEWAKLDSLSVR